ncbi:MAG: heparan-alpha-glucosaminide N-acetyltransferase domain-containing protein [Ferruginibacter sp.]
MDIPASVNKQRIRSIDLLRGLVMIIMALDHTRDFFHATAFTGNPLDPTTTTVWLYFTRWITHFCAPTFVFLAGTSAFLQGLRKNKKELSRFLITRGVWLILVEVIIINLAYFFDPTYATIGLQTIWAIGISMVILGLFIWLPFYVILLAGLAIVFGHNMLDIYEKAHPVYSVWYAILHRPGLFPYTENFKLFVVYPFLSWSGLMMVGYCFGKLLTNAQGMKRKNLLIWVGLAVTVFFFALRAANIYGDPGRWTNDGNPLHFIYSFLNTQKYPPSLLYMSMTIGPSILFLAFFDKAKGKLVEIISVYGRVPFFYYILHFYLIHVISSITFFLRGHGMKDDIPQNPLDPYFVIPGEGFSLPIVYLFWLFIVISLYPVCKWYDKYKMDHKENKFLSYL